MPADLCLVPYVCMPLLLEHLILLLFCPEACCLSAWLVTARSPALSAYLPTRTRTMHALRCTAGSVNYSSSVSRAACAAKEGRTAHVLCLLLLVGYTRSPPVPPPARIYLVNGLFSVSAASLNILPRWLVRARAGALALPPSCSTLLALWFAGLILSLRSCFAFPYDAKWSGRCDACRTSNCLIWFSLNNACDARTACCVLTPSWTAFQRGAGAARRRTLAFCHTYSRGFRSFRRALPVRCSYRNACTGSLPTTWHCYALCVLPRCDIVELPSFTAHTFLLHPPISSCHKISLCTFSPLTRCGFSALRTARARML